MCNTGYYKKDYNARPIPNTIHLYYHELINNERQECFKTPYNTLSFKNLSISKFSLIIFNSFSNSFLIRAKFEASKNILARAMYISY